MDPDYLEQLKKTLGQLPSEQQDHLAGFLLIERLKRNSLVTPSLHQRIDDSDPENWNEWSPDVTSHGDD